MKTSKKVLAVLLALAMVLTLAACGGGDTSSPASTPANDEPSSAASTPEESEPASQPEEDSSEPADEGEEEEEEFVADMTGTPRNETLYYGGEQWGKPVNMNPMSTTSNFGVISQNDIATVVVYETPYMYNPLDGKAYGLLADGDYTFNEDKSVLTFKIKAAAKWDDGTPVTAHDVQATWDAHVKYETATGADYGQYFTIKAVDDATVEITAGENHNPYKMEEYLCKVYVMQKAYLEKLDGELNGDSGEMKNAEMWDAPVSGAYRPTQYDSEQKWICTRNDDYWGQDASMWGKLPVPKYLAHNIYKDNDATARAMRNAEIDVDQQYFTNLQDTWQKDGLPISTYFAEAPYQLGMQMPSVIFNQTLPGLDQVAVRKAIAMAIDYDQVVTSAMTGQSYTFAEVPRSLFNPTEGEQALIRDPEALKPYQYLGKDVEGAQKLLDDAGIIDTDGDGIREYPEGNNLTFKCECPTGWNDWEASMNITAAAGKSIGINLETFFPESAQYNEHIQTAGFEISMSSYGAASIANPWTRAYQTMYGFGGNFPETMTFNHGRYYNAEVDEILQAMPLETDEAKVLEYFERLNIIYLDEVPSAALMYRPADFHEVNETVWTNFPVDGDGTNIPPLICWDGYGYAAMFNLELVEG